jgi:GT2 family glycosyltransferase
VSGIGITVGVATCGRPDALGRCLQGLAVQNAPPSEVIVVDQAPSAEARGVVAASGLKGARYLEQPRLGLSASRNLALASASEPALAVTDDDCVADPGWLEAVARALERPPTPGGVTGPVLPLGEATPDTFAVSLRESIIPADHSGRVIPWTVGTGGNFAARVSDLRSRGGWDERLGAGSPGQAGEDAELLYRLLVTGALIRYEPGAVMRHERQTRERRRSTRWSYGYGVGAMCGLWLARRDAYAVRMLAVFARYQLRQLLGGVRWGDRTRVAEHARMLAGLGAGLGYGLRAARTPPSRSLSQ